ncbi:MAG: hypothetical protein M1834_000831 [Cirrosporium novae-zelandiae]|nr:MAG: hypothetical protein M1834_000831 [Cirrosporium novae-zelandiae]
MQISAALLAFVLPLLSLATPTSSSEAAPSTLPPLEYLFRVSLNVDKPLNPIPIPGGEQLIEPIINGTITGPSLNGTIYHSIAYPTAYKIGNETVQYPEILVYGQSNDGESFLVQEVGVGAGSEQWSRIRLTVGGKYEYLSRAYILAHIQVARSAAVVQVDCWCVGCM